MKPRKPTDPDAITLREAAEIVGVSTETIRRWKREGLVMGYRHGRTAYSRSEALSLRENPWITGVAAARILGVGHVRVSQLASASKIPVHETPSGERVYRKLQIEVVANARRLRYPR